MRWQSCFDVECIRAYAQIYIERGKNNDTTQKDFPGSIQRSNFKSHEPDKHRLR